MSLKQHTQSRRSTCVAESVGETGVHPALLQKAPTFDWEQVDQMMELDLDWVANQLWLMSRFPQP